MLFSVIVTIYNLEEYLEKCLDSIIKQTYEEFEIILVDDGSSDKSGEICDYYSKRDSRVVVLHKKNGGLISARVAGLSIARGEYSIFVDADDWIENNELEVVGEIVNKYHPDMIEFGFFKEYSDIVEWRHASLEEGFYRKDILWNQINNVMKAKPCFVRPLEGTIWCKAVRTELFSLVENKLCPEITWGEDLMALYSLLHNIANVYITHCPLYHYVVRKDSMMHASSTQQLQLVKHELDMIWKRYCENDSIAYKQYLLKYMTFLEAPQYALEKYVGELFFQGQRIVIFGKGVFAKGLLEDCHKLNVSIVAVIDSYDIELLRKMDYDEIFIAITVSSIVEKVIQLLRDKGIEREKIKYIRYEDILAE